MNDYIDLEDVEDIDQDNGEDVEKHNEDFSRGEFSFTSFLRGKVLLAKNVIKMLINTTYM